MKKIFYLFAIKVISSITTLKTSITSLFLSRYGSNKYVKGILVCIQFLQGTYIYKLLKWILRIINVELNTNTESTQYFDPIV